MIDWNDHLATVPMTLEAKRAQLVRLNFLAGRNPRLNLDDRCQFCGLGPGEPSLCDRCEARRQQLAAELPDVPELKPFTEIARAQLEAPPADYVAQPTIHVRNPELETWLPWKETED